jgi:hypothetical protein
MLKKMAKTNSIKQALLLENAGIIDTKRLAIEQSLNSLFFTKAHDEEERKGLHASAIIESESKFCIREQVLSLIFKRNKNESKTISPGLMRIFEEGNYIHLKWQNLFERNKIAIGIEDRGYSAMYDLYMTPDAIVKIKGKTYVVEIKSCNTFSFKHITNTHPKGTKQLQLYMHFTCIPRGFVLCEDKNTQEIKILIEEYNPEKVRPYIERLNKIMQYKRMFDETGKMAKRKCSTISCKRALECPMANACFGLEREKLKIN